MVTEADTCINKVQRQGSTGCKWAHTGLGQTLVVFENHAVHTTGQGELWVSLFTAGVSQDSQCMDSGANAFVFLCT